MVKDDTVARLKKRAFPVKPKVKDANQRTVNVIQRELENLPPALDMDLVMKVSPEQAKKLREDPVQLALLEERKESQTERSVELRRLPIEQRLAKHYSVVCGAGKYYHTNLEIKAPVPLIMVRPDYNHAVEKLDSADIRHASALPRETFEPEVLVNEDTSKYDEACARRASIVKEVLYKLVDKLEEEDKATDKYIEELKTLKEELSAGKPSKRVKISETSSATKKAIEIPAPKVQTPSFSKHGKTVAPMKLAALEAVRNRNDKYLGLRALAPILTSIAGVNSANDVYKFSISSGDYIRFQLPEFTIGDWHLTLWFELAELLLGAKIRYDSVKTRYPLFAVSIDKERAYCHSGENWVSLIKTDSSQIEADMQQLIGVLLNIELMSSFISNPEPKLVSNRLGTVGRTNSITFKSKDTAIEDVSLELLAPSHLLAGDLSAWNRVKTPWSCSMLTGWSKTSEVLGFKVCFRTNTLAIAVMTGLGVTLYNDNTFENGEAEVLDSPLRAQYELIKSKIATQKTLDKKKNEALPKEQSNDEPTTTQQLDNWMSATHRLTQVGENCCVEVAITHALYLEHVPRDRVVLDGNSSIIKTFNAHGLQCKAFAIGKLKGKPGDSLLTRLQKTGRDARIPAERFIIESKCVTRVVEAGKVDYHCNYAEVNGEVLTIWNTWNLTYSEPTGPPSFKFRLEELYQDSEPDYWQPLKVYFIYEKCNGGERKTQVVSLP